MTKISGLLSALLVFTTGHTGADDIEIYFNGANVESSPYIHFLLDWRPSVFFDLCIVGSTCLSSNDSVNNPCPSSATCMSDLILANLTAKDGLDKRDGESVNHYEAFVAVLKAIFEDSRFSSVHVALMSSNDQTSQKWLSPKPGTLKTGGGVILEGYKRLGVAGEREQLLATLKAIPSDPKSATAHELQLKEAYFEWARYIKGGQWEYGPTGFESNYGSTFTAPKHDVSTLASGNYNSLRVSGPDAADLYDSPFQSEDCPALYSVAMIMSPVESDNNLTDKMNRDWKRNWGDSLEIETLWNYLHASDTDLVDFIPGNQQLSKSWVISQRSADGGWWGEESASAAAAGGAGGPMDFSQPNEIYHGIESAFVEIQSVSSTFVSATVPVNVFNQSRAVDEVFIGLFEPQENINWPGNVKKLKLTDDPNDPDRAFDAIVDANGNPGFATSGSNKGRISFNALTFWTDDTQLLSSAQLDQNNSSDPNNSSYVPDMADGRVVDRGGAGQKIPGLMQGYTPVVGNSNGGTNRTVYVEDPGNAIDGLVDFSIALAAKSGIQASFGVTDPNETRLLIRWARGQDLNDSDGDNQTEDSRFWILGDTIHSRPVALNYGDTGANYGEDNPDVKLLFGSGNGSFHMLENTGTSRNDHTGTEVFAYYPLELLDQVKARRSGTVINSGTEMQYGVDGTPAVLTNDANSDGSLVAGTDEAYVFFGLRRGGYSYHALDIIDVGRPKLVWRISETRSDGNSSTTDFDELGLTFSRPQVTKVSYNGASVDALIFAGGYYGGADPNNPPSQFGKDVNSDEDSWGNAIYVVNARSGALIWKAVGGANVSASPTRYVHPDMGHSMPSDVTVLETKGGFAHRIYVGDTGGNVWRADIPPGDCPFDTICATDSQDWREQNWFVSRLAELPATPNEDVRFFHAPDVVESTLAGGTFFDGIIISSGNRADPLDTRFTASANYIYYLRDFRVASGDAAAVIPMSGGVEIPYYNSGSLAERSNCTGDNDGNAGCDPIDPNASAPAGWKVALDNAVGEKGLATPLVDAGRVFATSYIPGSTGTCGSFTEGNGRLYVLNLGDATPAGNQQSYTLGRGIPSSPTLIGEAIWIPGGGVEADLDGDGKQDDSLTRSLTKRLIPIYWREPGIDDL
ncbi:MAG: hypothetical protein V7696_15730 [Halioglobus sp.]